MNFDRPICSRRWWRHRSRMLAGAAGLAVLLVCFFVIDGSACAWMRANQGQPWEGIAQTISWLGDWPVLAGAAILGLFATARLGSRRWVHVLCVMLAASMLAGAVANVVRVTAGRARPNVKIEKRWYGPRDGKVWTAGRHAYSAFPSAHTTVAAAFVAPLVFLGWRWGIGAISLMILVGWSRFYLGVHHPSDVLAGAALGWGCAWVLCFTPPARRVMRRISTWLCHPRVGSETGTVPRPVEEVAGV